MNHFKNLPDPAVKTAYLHDNDMTLLFPLPGNAYGYTFCKKACLGCKKAGYPHFMPWPPGDVEKIPARGSG